MLERAEQPGRNALRLRPGVRQPLDALRVGVLGRGEAALRQREVAEQVLAGLLDHLPVALLAGDHPRVQVRGDEQRVVVEHLLEVRDEPVGVHRVAVEAAADDVVHPARRHRVERGRDHLQLAAAEQELERRGRRELRRAAEAAPLGVEHSRRGRAPPPRASSRSAARPTARASLDDRIASTSWAADRPTSARRSRYAEATASSTWRKLGRPCRGAGGKYVPPKNGSPPGVRKTVIGQPPCPVSATTASM